ncbi:MAG: hypothetical protein KJ070_20330 [Verrucomicrobia bacterium]|nr:hypothetical protein [Verrucomicrobiota bacterium]
MKKPIRNVMPAALMTICFLTGCGKSPDQLDRNWTAPGAISVSPSGLGGAIVLHEFQDTLIGIAVHQGSVQLHRLNPDKNSWSELSIGDIPSGYLWYGAAIDPQNGRVLVPNGYSENEQLAMKVLVAMISQNGSLEGVTEKQWITDKKSLLGETGPSVTLNRPTTQYDRANREGAGLGVGVVNGVDILIPYAVNAFTYSETPVHYQGKTHYRKAFERGPFASGIFYSPDSGKTWQLEKISQQMAIAPALCKTKEHIYYFAGVYPLWSSRRLDQGGQWEKPREVATTFAMVSGIFDVAGDGDTAHICWMDRRHNKTRFNLTGPPIENNDIYYRRRKDSDREWSKEIWLSKGLLYCYAPTIAAEGDNVVVAWAGIHKAGRQHSDMGPNDIYYVTSKDGGQTWTKLLKVTDGAKDGITAGMPQVALLNGTIHLLYIQGAQQSPKELSPGLTKLGQGPWPIYHTQRPFPK